MSSRLRSTSRQPIKRQNPSFDFFGTTDDDFDREFNKTARTVRRAWVGMFLFVIAFWVTAIVILLLVLRHFGIV